MAAVDLKDDRSEIVHYDYEEYPIYVRRALLSSYNNFAAPPHWHDDIELITVLQGEMNYSINNEMINVRQGEGVFVNSGRLHYGFSKEKHECDFICILIHPLLLCVSQAFEQNYVVPLLNNQSIPYIKLSADIQWQKEVLNCIEGMYRAKGDTTAPLMLVSLFMKIWTTIFEYSNTPVSIKSYNSDFTILKNMIGYIQKFYREKVTLADIAAAGAVGQSKCCQLFKRYVGVTPNAYLVQYRIHQSIWYLKNTDMTITGIAQAVGFSGSSYYAEAFRKWCKISPSEYRKMNRFD